MLRLKIPAGEFYDEVNNRFIYTKATTLQLEHSLVSISKWESKWEKPFFSKTGQTYEETIDYIRCMTITQNVDPSVYARITNEQINAINEYISKPMTATYLSEDKRKSASREPVTSELIYYWMIAYNIPPEYQKWHLNRLLMLIRVCERKSTPVKKRSPKEIMAQNAAINASRRKRLHTKG